MEDIVAILTVFGAIAFVMYTVVRGLVRAWELSRQARVMTRLVETVGTGADAAALIESPAGRALFDRMSDRRTLVLQGVLRSVQSGIVLTILGIALYLLRPAITDQDSRTALLVFGVLAAALGIAFLVAAGVSFLLSRRWGLLEPS